MGMTPRQRLLRVELPLALPAIVAGIRVATVVGVGTVTIAAAIGAGGLGEYIYRGLSMVDATVILAGAVPAAALALVADATLLLIERALSARRRRRRSGMAVAAGLVLFLGGGALLALPGADRIVVGSKNFTEQIVLGELMAQTIERYTDLRVDRKLNLGGTFICDRALSAGDIDVYAEYSGTAPPAVFKQALGRDPQVVRDTVRRLYADTGRTLLEPFGFDNTFAILIRSDDARAHGLVRLSDLPQYAPGWQAAFGYEFLEREDG